MSVDYLRRPPHLEKQQNSSDLDYNMFRMIKDILCQIRDSLVSPSVLCHTDVQGGSSITGTEDRTIKFLSGGMPVTVYKILLWTNSSIAIRASVVGMASGADGFVIPTTPFVLEVPVSELSIALNTTGTVGVNIPSGISANGSVFIYGFTTPNSTKNGEW